MNRKIETTRKEHAVIIQLIDEECERIRLRSFTGISKDMKAKWDFLQELSKNLNNQFDKAEIETENQMIRESIGVTKGC